MDGRIAEIEKNNANINISRDLGSVPVIGMIFKSEDDAYSFYNAYAKRAGFSIRKYDRYYRRKDNKLMWRSFCCSCQGERKKHPSGTPNKPRAQSRFNCLAQLKIEIDECSSNYRITEFIEQHTHNLTPHNKAHMLRSHRSIRPAQRCLIESMTAAGIGSHKIHYYCATEAGGVENVGFTQFDCDREVQKRRVAFLKKGDGQILLAYFKRKEKENKSFFYQIQMDDNNQILNCFWCDAKSRIDYHCYGDVVCFDTTYQTNDYDMPFAPFVGVNNHSQTIIFAGALLSDETTESFVWLFETFLDAMAGKMMETIFTDQAPAISNAIKRVFPMAHHRLCIWHIYQNALKNLSHVFTEYESFRDDFRKCIYDGETEEEFLSHWTILLQTYKLQVNPWLLRLFEFREKWAQVYARDHFCAGMASTQRSESMNNYFKKYFRRKQILSEFVVQYEKAILLRRQKEVHEDVKSDTTEPDKQSRFWPVEHYAARFYTRKMFNRFQEGLKKCFDLVIKEAVSSGAIQRYKVSYHDSAKTRTVELELPMNNVKCSCKKFEFTGILCEHILKVLREKNISDVPSQLLQHGTSIGTGTTSYGYYSQLLDEGPNIDNYMGEFSEILRPFILSYEDVEKDGNCGFRALAVAMGWTEEAWKQVRVDLLQEVTLYRDEYSKMFGGDEVVTKLQERLKPLVSPARYDNWMLMPEAGYLASSRYNTAIVYIASRHCLSFLPLRSSVDAYGPKVVSIGHVQQNHFIKLNLASECPIPPPVEFWNRYHYQQSESWVESLRNRIEAFTHIGVTINTRDAAPGEVIVLDS